MCFTELNLTLVVERKREMDGSSILSFHDLQMSAEKGDCFVSNETKLLNVKSANNFIVKKAPPTIRYIPDFISPEEEQFLLHNIYKVPKPKWHNLLNRRLQDWGGALCKDYLIQDSDIPPWLNAVIEQLVAIDDTFPPAHRPNHVLINEYLPGQGIMAHTDGPAFYPLVATISLNSDVLIDYYKPFDPEKSEARERRYLGSMLLKRRSLVLMSDDIYTYWHEIADRLVDVITDSVFNLEHVDETVGEVISRTCRSVKCKQSS
ncbi:unnamed protein product [Thelazia callipaeda]|uniref:2OG-FeII_Oxy_2 domain-containing protein n=1 Tax=Thelazia callipaeda TaxID=103827 RepID=A0A0N5CZ30_THECL|nr:unnamed protein product [Thelazia callipaeda]